MFKEKLVTIWSAPNYCYRYIFIIIYNYYNINKIRCGNIAAILELDENL